MARDSLSPIEEAIAYAKFIKVENEKGEEITLWDQISKGEPRILRLPSDQHPQVIELASKIGRYTSPMKIRERLRLLALPTDVQNMVDNREIKLAVAKTLARLIRFIYPFKPIFSENTFLGGRVIPHSSGSFSLAT